MSINIYLCIHTSFIEYYIRSKLKMHFIQHFILDNFLENLEIVFWYRIIFLSFTFYSLALLFFVKCVIFLCFCLSFCENYKFWTKRILKVCSSYTIHTYTHECSTAFFTECFLHIYKYNFIYLYIILYINTKYFMHAIGA